jgi:hypothetical protein
VKFSVSRSALGVSRSAVGKFGGGVTNSNDERLMFDWPRADYFPAFSFAERETPNAERRLDLG